MPLGIPSHQICLGLNVDQFYRDLKTINVIFGWSILDEHVTFFWTKKHFLKCYLENLQITFETWTTPDVSLPGIPPPPTSRFSIFHILGSKKRTSSTTKSICWWLQTSIWNNHLFIWMWRRRQNIKSPYQKIRVCYEEISFTKQILTNPPTHFFCRRALVSEDRFWRLDL